MYDNDLSLKERSTAAIRWGSLPTTTLNDIVELLEREAVYYLAVEQAQEANLPLRVVECLFKVLKKIFIFI